MARFSRLKVLNTVIDTGLVPVFYHADAEVTKNVLKACATGGANVFEFTNPGDFAPEVFRELSRYLAKEHPEIILGMGSVIDEPTAALYIAYGANFVVGPVLNEAVARLCNRRKVAYMPGCGSASEISYAEELGVEIVKVFPGSSVAGPAGALCCFGGHGGSCTPRHGCHRKSSGFCCLAQIVCERYWPGCYVDRRRNRRRDVGSADG